MATIQLSPSVIVQETDLSSIIPAVATSTGACVGEFAWGPVEEITPINNETQLVSVFGKPSDDKYKDFMCAASFLAYASNLQVVRVVDTSEALNATATIPVNGAGVLIKNLQDYQSKSFSASTNLFIAKYPGTLGNSLGVAWADATGFDDTDSNGDYTWSWRDLFSDTPGTNEYHIVVYDADGGITGEAGSALEIYAFVSSVSTAKYYDGTSGFFKTRINNISEWLWVGKDSLLTSTSDGQQLGNGDDGSAVTDGDRETGLVLFQNAEKVDISLIFAAGGSKITSKWIIDNIAETRLDCVAFVSPEEADCVNLFDDAQVLQNILTTRTSYGSSSYAVMDSAYKWMYDRYNDINRWVPLNGDIAGLCAKTDNVADPWFSPAGYNRGNLKNTIALSNDQPKNIRDSLYSKGINPCLIFPQEGPILYGDKTLQTKPSAFDRINVRRLFIVLEKAIATAAKYMLFEQNDDITRAQFVNMVEPFLRDVKGRRGIYDFKVICDSSNNTADVIDSNEFVADIYIKPVKSINWVQLNFVALRSGVSFDEVVQSGTSV